MEDGLNPEVLRVASEIRAVDVGGRRYRVRVAAERDRIVVWCDGEILAIDPPSARGTRSRPGGEEAGLRAPMPGKILRTLVRAGEAVRRGSTLLILEAMKMEHEIKAPRDGTIAQVPFATGDQVEAGAVLVEFAP